MDVEAWIGDDGELRVALVSLLSVDFFFQAEDGIRDYKVTGVQTCALPILIVLLFFFSRYIPRPFSAFAPPGEDFDDFEGIYSNSDRLTKFLQSLGPYSPAVLDRKSVV